MNLSSVYHEQPVVVPHSIHSMQEPLRFIFIEPQFVQVSPVKPCARAVCRVSGSVALMATCLASGDFTAAAGAVATGNWV